MAYTLGSKCAENLCKRIVLLQLIIENVFTCFFGTQCISPCTVLHRRHRTRRHSSYKRMPRSQGGRSVDDEAWGALCENGNLCGAF